MLAVAGCAGGGGAAKTPLEKHLEARDYRLPRVISYDDFYQASLNEGVVGVDEELQKLGIPVRGSGSDRFIHTSDLLRACGPDCNYHEGWGIFLSDFAHTVHRD